MLASLAGTGSITLLVASSCATAYKPAFLHLPLSPLHKSLSTIPRPATTTLAMSSSPPPADSAEGASGDQTLGKVIDGKSIALTIRAELTEELSALGPDATDRPGLAVMLVGARKDSQTYVRMKQKACADCGMVSFLQKYEDVDDAGLEERLLSQIRDWNADPKVHGILVQLPLPEGIDEARVLRAVSPEKDVDGLHPANTAALFSTATHAGNARLDWRDFASVPFHVPCTPQGCIELIDRIGVAIEGKNAVVIGRSNLVGLPVAMLLCHRNATVTVAHSRTRDIEAVVRRADIVVAAVGRARMVPPSWLKEGCVVVDVGINSVDDPSAKRGYRLVGDVDYEGARKVAGWITPVPGGVGPMTIAMLLRNTRNSWRRSTAETGAVDEAQKGEDAKECDE